MFNNNINAYELKKSTDDDKYPLYKLTKDELKAFINYAKKVEKITRKDIKVNKSLNYETLPNVPKPSNVPKDVTLTSMRMSQKSRIIGFRQQEYYYIVWFDVNHRTC